MVGTRNFVVETIETLYAVDKIPVEKLPQMDLVKSKGYDVFILSEDIDEFMISVYINWPFWSHID